MSSKLQIVLADLSAVDCVGDLGLAHESFDLDANIVNIPLAADVNLYFSPNHNVLPRLADNTVNWMDVTRIKILSIGDQK